MPLGQQIGLGSIRIPSGVCYKQVISWIHLESEPRHRRVSGRVLLPPRDPARCAGGFAVDLERSGLPSKSPLGLCPRITEYNQSGQRWRPSLLWKTDCAPKADYGNNLNLHSEQLGPSRSFWFVIHKGRRKDYGYTKAKMKASECIWTVFRSVMESIKL